MWLHLPLRCMWQTLLINHMTFPPKVQSGTQILDTVLLAAATNGLVVSCQMTPLLTLEIGRLRIREGK